MATTLIVDWARPEPESLQRTPERAVVSWLPAKAVAVFESTSERAAWLSVRLVIQDLVLSGSCTLGLALSGSCSLGLALSGSCSLDLALSGSVAEP